MNRPEPAPGFRVSIPPDRPNGGGTVYVDPSQSGEEPAGRDGSPAAPDLLAQVPVVNVRVTRYAASCLPQDDINADLFTLSIEERSSGRWAVLRGGFCYDADGNREYESIPSERADEFKARFRHSLEDALELAQRIAPTMTVNGHTVADALARGERS